MPNSAHREVTLRDGRTLAFNEYGVPSGRPIIYCHGAPSSRAEGDLIIDNAAASALGLRVIVPDRPGIGRSQPHSGRRIVDWPNDVVDLAAALSAMCRIVEIGTRALYVLAAAFYLLLGVVVQSLASADRRRSQQVWRASRRHEAGPRWIRPSWATMRQAPSAWNPRSSC